MKSLLLPRLTVASSIAVVLVLPACIIESSSSDIGTSVLPHHLYLNADRSRLYATALGGLLRERAAALHRGHRGRLPRWRAAVESADARVVVRAAPGSAAGRSTR